MGIVVVCAACKRQYKNIKEELAGKRVRCQCGQEMIVPSPQPQPAFENLEVEALETVQPAPATMSPVGHSWRSGSSTRKTQSRARSQNKRSSSGKEPYRLADIICIVCGGLLFAMGVYSIFGRFFTFLAMAGSSATLSHYEQIPDEIKVDVSARVIPSIVFGLLGGLASIAMGICGGAVGLFVYEKKEKGSSEYSWGFTGLLFTAIACLLLSIIHFVCMLVSGYGIGGIAFELILLIRDIPIPAFALALYFFRGKLEFSELQVSGTY